MNNAADEMSQRERREVIRNDRRVREGSTYHSIGQASLDDQRGGRYAALKVDEIRGVLQSRVPPSLWENDPPEPPLGYSVDALEPVGEPFEVTASRRAPPPVISRQDGGEGGGSNSDGTSEGRPATSSKFRRRY